MKRTILLGLCLLAMTFVSPIMAQWNNTPHYQFSSAEPISTSFRSTGTMTESGSRYASTPMLNADGSPTYAGAPAMSGPRRIGPAPSSDISTEDLVPVGDALIPLLLMVMAYATLIHLRRRKRA